MNHSLTFQNHTLTTIARDNQIYLTASDLSRALEYVDTRSITAIYRRNQDEFSSDMSSVVNLTTLGSNLPIPTRIFSLRGAHLVAMFSRTPVAKEFRRWVLDILDQQTKAKPQAWIVAPGQTPIPLADMVVLHREAIQGVMAAVEMIHDVSRNYLKNALESV